MQARVHFYYVFVGFLSKIVLLSAVFLVSARKKRDLFAHIRKKLYLCSRKLQRLQNMAYNTYDKLEWTLIFVSEFGKRFGLSLKQAFNYLSRYQGIAFVDSHYDYVHTQSFSSMVNDMAEYCHKNGGALV